MYGGPASKDVWTIMFCQDAIGPSLMRFERLPGLGARMEAIDYQGIHVATLVAGWERERYYLGILPVVR